MVSGIANTSNRRTVVQGRHCRGWSSFSPVANSAMITANSVRRSNSLASATGSSHSMSKAAMTAAAAAPRPR